MRSYYYFTKFKKIFVDINGIGVFAETFEDHLSRLRTVLERLREVNLKTKLMKCFFAQEELRFLGHTDNQHSLRPKPENVKAIENGPVPTNLQGGPFFS